jgi:hypothetical protein
MGNNVTAYEVRPVGRKIYRVDELDTLMSYVNSMEFEDKKMPLLAEAFMRLIPEMTNTSYSEQEQTITYIKYSWFRQCTTSIARLCKFKNYTDIPIKIILTDVQERILNTIGRSDIPQREGYTGKTFSESDIWPRHSIIPALPP